MTNNKLEQLDAVQLATISGGSAQTKLISNRLSQIWGHVGPVELVGKQSFEGLNGASFGGSGKFTVFQGPGGTQERSWVGSIVNGTVTRIRTKLVGWVD